MTIKTKKANLAIIELDVENVDEVPLSFENEFKDVLTLLFIFEIKLFTLFTTLFAPCEMFDVVLLIVFESIENYYILYKHITI
jgi:hypothetical protein